MVWNVDYRTARSSPTRPADSGTFFLGPISERFPAVFLLHFLEMPKIMSTQLTLRYLWHFQDMLEICKHKPRLGIPGFARNAKSGFELTYFHTFPGKP